MVIGEAHIEDGTGRTRRGFLGAIAVAGVAGTVARTAPAAAAGKPCTPSGPGVRTAALAITSDGKTVWTADSARTTITAHRGRTLARGRSIDVGGAPLAIAISPDGRIALVTTAFYDHPGLAIVDLRTGDVDHVDVGPEPGAVVFAPDGRSAYVAGGGRDGHLTRVDPRSGRVHEPIALGDHPRGLAMHPDGKRALVAVNGAAHLAYVSLASRRVRRIPTRAFPYQVAISPNGARALATHNGFRDRFVTPVDLAERRAGRPAAVGPDPAGVAYAASGRQALVAVTGARAVAVVNGRTGRRARTVKQPGAPRSVVVAGSRAIVADGATGRLSAIRLGVGR